MPTAAGVRPKTVLFIYLTFARVAAEPPDCSPSRHAGPELRKLQGHPGPVRWEWPERASLILGRGEASYTEAVAKAGLPYSQLLIALPSTPCTSLGPPGSPTEAAEYRVVAHAHDQAHLDVLVHGRGVLAPVHLFLGPYLTDGYEVTLGNASLPSTIRRGSTSASYSGQLLQEGNISEAFWISFSVSSGQASLSIGLGTSPGDMERLILTDASPPPVTAKGIYLWLLHASGEWEVCPASREATLTPAHHPMPMIKLLHAASADSDCRYGGGQVPMLTSPYLSAWPLPLALSEAGLSSNASVAFMHGGRYRLCYKPDATNRCVCQADGVCECEPGGGTCTLSASSHGSCDPFKDPLTAYRSTLLPISLQVLGVSSSCRTDGCLARERWDCYFAPLRRDGRGSCALDLSPETGRFGWSLTPGAAGRMTWTATYGPDAHVRGVLWQTRPRPCGESAGASENFELPGRGGALASLELLPESGGAVEMPRVAASVLEPFAVGVCYCPDVASRRGARPCSAREDFVQAFGVLYMWTLSLCDYDPLSECSSPYLRVVPQQKFTMKLKCPPGGGCAAGDGNRVKLLESRSASGPQHANWDASAHCKAIRQESEHAIWPELEDTLALSGGPRVDYKVWAEKQVLLDRTLGVSFDVCYCNGDCTTAANWIQAGTVRTSHAFAFASSISAAGNEPRMRTLEYVNKPGSFTLYSGMHTPSWQAEASPYDSNRFSGFAILNFMSFDREETKGRTLADKHSHLGGGLTELQGTMDRECQREVTSSDLVEGLASRADIFTHMAFATVAGASATSSSHMAFAGADKDKTMTVRKAGTLAVCYCGRATTSGRCLTNEQWLFAGLLQIRGPLGGQTWTLPTQMIVRLAGIRGWGFDRTDRLKLLETGASCSDNDFRPSGSTWFKVGCPMGSASAAACQEAGTTQLVVPALKDSGSTGVRIQSIHVEGPRSSVLSFSGPITNHLQEGDAITISPQHILVDGRPVSQMHDLQKYAAFKLAGQDPYQDNPTRSFFRYWHNVSLVGQQADVGSVPGVDSWTSKLRIPVGWDSESLGGMPTFTFPPPTSVLSSEPQWVRRSSMDTDYELKVMRTRQRMPICWSPMDGGSQKSYAQVGEVTFEAPALMQAAILSLTTRQSGALAPVVISFTVNPMKKAYEGVKGEMLLTLRFLQTSKLAVASGTAVLDSASSLPVSGISQAACGHLFLELWASDAHGFPVPRGCYYSAVDINGQREVFMVFDRFNGLRNICRSFRSVCNYQLVINTVATDLKRWDQVLDIYSGCRFESGGCRSEFEIYEKGEVAPSLGTLNGAGINDARLALESGFELLDIDGRGVHHLNASTEASIHARLRAAGPPGIQRGAYLRIFLAPLTQWDAGSTACQLSCIAFNPPVYTCGNATGAIICMKEQVVTTRGVPQNYNKVKVILPSEMDTIVGDVSHTIRVAGLKLPQTALFPTRLGVELSSPDDIAPQYVQSGGAVAFLGDGSPSAEGRLLLDGRTGGGPRPFQGERNTLYVRLQFSATLWTGYGTAGGTGDDSVMAAFVDIIPPPGYACHVRGTGEVPHTFATRDAHAGYALIRERDAAYGNEPQRLFLLDRDIDEQPDFPRGTISVADTDGSWDPSLGRVGCSYGLRTGQAIHAGQSVYVQLSVENPDVPLRRYSPSNVWAMQLRATSALDDSGPLYSTQEDAFMSLAQESALPHQEADLWAGSAAVLGSLGDVFVQPESFTPGAVHALSIFFSTTQEVGYGGEVVVDAPLSFVFNENCVVQDLESSYYDPFDPAMHQLSLGPVLPLANRGGCIGQATPQAFGIGTNRARIRVHGRLAMARTYGFQLQVANPSAALAPNESSWYVWTADASGSWTDGSAQTAALTPGAPHQGWVLYQQAWPSPPTITVQGGRLRPYRVFRALDTVVVQRLALAGLGRRGVAMTSLRLTAPPICRFSDPSAGGLRLSADGSTASLPHSPQLGSPQELLWPALTLQEGEVYGFHASLEVLESASQASLHAFFLELGYASASFGSRLGAVAAAAPSLARIIAAPVDYLTSRLGYRRNSLIFRINIASGVPVGRDAALEIKGGEGLRGAHLACRPAALAMQSLPLPADTRCEAQTDAVGAPRLLLMPDSVPFSSGLYALEVQASNPPVATAAGSVDWTVSTLFGVSDALSRAAIDAPAAAAGFALRSLDVSAAILSGMAGPARDDRPGRINSVLLSFSLSLGPEAEQPESSLLALRAPWGFAFPQRCLQAIFTSREGVFGGRPGDQEEFEDWPPSLAPTSCTAQGHVATLNVPRGLKSGLRYALRASVTNPEAPPPRNAWSLEYDGATSEPVEGFPLAAVAFPAAIEAVSAAAGLLVEAPVTILFTLQQRVPPGGELRVTAPSSFTLKNATALRPHGAMPDTLVSYEAPVSSADGSTLAVQVGPSGLSPLQPWVLQVLAINPATKVPEGDFWVISSFSATRPEGLPLDEGRLASYDLVQAAGLAVENIGDNYYSLEPVSIFVTITSPVPTLFGDVLRLRAPAGLQLALQTPAYEYRLSPPRSCSGFTWMVWLSLTPQPIPSCACVFGPCELSFVPQPDPLQPPVADDVAYKAGWPLKFRLVSANPAQEPSLEQAYWHVAHTRGGGGAVLAAAAQRSWRIRPKLAAASVAIVGSNQAAEAESTLLVSFVPVSVADHAKLVAEHPREMNFDGATVEAPYRKDDRSGGQDLIVSRLNLISGSETSILVANVRLGRGGGRSVFSLMTYKNSELEETVEERLHFEAFYQSGRATVQGTLQSLYATHPEAYPARSTLPARGLEEAQATFHMSFTFAVAFGDRLLLRCEGDGAYELRVDNRFSVSRLREVQAGVERERVPTHAEPHGSHSIEALLVSDGPSSTSSPKALVFQPGTEAEVIVWVMPTLGINNWRVETFQDSLLTNTNDGVSTGFAPVAPLTVLLQAHRSPPQTLVQAQLQAMAPKGVLTGVASTVPEVVLVAPPGFTFPEDCGDLCTPLPDTFASTGRAMAELRTPGTGTLLGAELSFRTLTPVITPPQLQWIVQARGVDGDMLGWGAVQGFEVYQMPDTSVLYGAIQGLQAAQIVFQFTFTSEPGDRLLGIIEVSAPQAFELSCSTGRLRRVSLPGGPPSCEREGPGQLRLGLDTTLQPGSYAFSAMATLPVETPEPNTFTLLIRDSASEAVADAAFNVPGWPLVHFLVSQPTLAWTTVGLGERSSVTVGFALSNYTGDLRALVFNLPPGFRQMVRTPADVKSSNSRLPLLKGGQDWIDSSSPSRLRILLETTDPIVAAGSYQLTFPVDLPENAKSISPLNIWHFDLCSDRSCLEPRSSNSIASFPMAGFMPGEVSELEEKRRQVALSNAGTGNVVSHGNKMVLGKVEFVLVLVLLGFNTP